MSINKKLTLKFLHLFCLFGKVLYYSSKLQKKKKKAITSNTWWKIKMPQNILHTFFFFFKNKQGEKRFCYIILSGLLSHYKSCTLSLGGRRERTSFLRVVHSWFLMSVCVFVLITSTPGRKKKQGSSSSSLMHCHYNISTWKARDPQSSRHWTKTLQIPVSLMMERWTESRN